MRKIIIPFTVLLFAVSQGVFAQLTIFGNVVDSKDGSGVPGAYVAVKGTNIIGTTNDSGNFGLMNVPNDAILQVSFVGYKTVEVPIENQTRFNITLELDIQALGEVIVSAARVIPPERVEIMAGIVRDKITLSYPVVVISGDEFAKFGWAVLEDVPGFLNGRLRGQTSWSSSTNTGPLFVVDGVPMRGSPEWLDSFMIESITVVRSASAGIFYGSPGANGVVIIKLKK